MRKARVLKRVLLILLCAAIIAALPVNFVEAADNESTERNVLNEKSDDITEVRSSKASAAVKTGEVKVSFLIAFVRTKPDGSVITYRIFSKTLQ